jgi:mono/diheme cytochrome c family protein
MRSRLLTVVLLAPYTLLGACGSDPAVSAIMSLTADPTAGQTVFQTNCQSCHGADASSGTARKPMAAEVKSNTQGAASTVLSGEDAMPSFAGTLSNQQIADVLGYIKSL